MADAPHSMSVLLEQVLERLPGVRRAVERHGHDSLARYAALLRRPDPASPHPPLQSPDDLLERAHARTGRLLGPERADALAEALGASLSALTANHHGLDCLAQSVQGVLSYAVGSDAHCPVLACGMVPLSSFSYPRGLCLSRMDPDTGASLRVPVFPSSMRYVLVHAAPPLTSDMASRAAGRAAALGRQGLVTGDEARFMADFLDRDCLDPAVLACPRYADQAVVLQARLLDRLLPQGPRVTVLELEDLAVDLLLEDLGRDCLASAVCLDGRLRSMVLDALDGVEGCWNQSLLAGLAREGGGQNDRAGAGTALFWGLDAKGRRVPLACVGSGPEAMLAGQALASSGGRAERLEVPLRVDALLQALRQGRLAPGLFLSYAVIGFARGLRCCGGVFQTDYMTRMRGGLAEALLAHGAASEARAVSAVAVDNFIAGPEVAFLEGHDGLRAAGPRPAGLIELAARGGLDRAALEAAGRLTLRQGLLAGLVDLAEEFVPPEQRPRGWRDDVARWLKEQPGVVLV